MRARSRVLNSTIWGCVSFVVSAIVLIVATYVI